MGVRIPNDPKKRAQAAPRFESSLPRELFERGGSLEQLVEKAGNAATRGTFGAAPLAKATQEALKLSCPDYQPSLFADRVVHCRSGEDSGSRPYRFDCQHCIVSQFSPKGFFTGDNIVPAAVLQSEGTAASSAV